MHELETVFKMLADETRLRLLMALREDKYCVCELVALFNLSQPKVSKHLAMLKAHGFVTSQRVEKYVYYTVDADAVLVRDVLRVIHTRRPLYPQLMEDAARIKQIQSLEDRPRIVCDGLGEDAR